MSPISFDPSGDPRGAREEQPVLSLSGYTLCDATQETSGTDARRKRAAAGYWGKQATYLLNQQGYVLSKRERPFLVNVQHNCSRTLPPTEKQKDWIRSIRREVTGGVHVS